MDYVPTNKWVLYGRHFAAIAGAGPLVGPVLAAQMGFLPGTLWILAGVVVAGAVQDFIVLFASVRRDGKSLGEMIKMELGPGGGLAGLGRRARDHDHHTGGAEPHCGQGADWQPLGAIHDRGNDP
jgi:carbon starvation protein